MTITLIELNDWVDQRAARMVNLAGNGDAAEARADAWCLFHQVIQDAMAGKSLPDHEDRDRNARITDNFKWYEFNRGHVPQAIPHPWPGMVGIVHPRYNVTELCGHLETIRTAKGGSDARWLAISRALPISSSWDTRYWASPMR